MVLNVSNTQGKGLCSALSTVKVYIIALVSENSLSRKILCCWKNFDYLSSLSELIWAVLPGKVW